MYELGGEGIVIVMGSFLLKKIKIWGTWTKILLAHHCFNIIRAILLFFISSSLRIVQRDCRLIVTARKVWFLMGGNLFQRLRGIQKLNRRLVSTYWVLIWNIGIIGVLELTVFGEVDSLIGGTYYTWFSFLCYRSFPRDTANDKLFITSIIIIHMQFGLLKEILRVLFFSSFGVIPF